MQRSGFQDPFFFIHYLILLLCLMTMDAPPTGTDKQYYHVFKSFSHLGWQSSVWSRRFETRVHLPAKHNILDLFAKWL